MQGLLEGLGMAFSGGLAGAGKAAGDVFSEQVKQEALAAREENMARINNIYAKDLQKEGFAHAEKLETGRQKHSEALAQSGYEHAEYVLGENKKHSEVMFEKEVAARANQAADQNAFLLGLEDIRTSKQLELEKIRDENQRKLVGMQYDNAVKLQKAAQSAPGATWHLFQDLKKMGVADDKATAMVMSGLSGEKEKDAAFLKLSAEMIRNATTSGTALDKAGFQEIFDRAREESGKSPVSRAGAGQNSFDQIASAWGTKKKGALPTTMAPEPGATATTPTTGGARPSPYVNVFAGALDALDVKNPSRTPVSSGGLLGEAMRRNR